MFYLLLTVSLVPCYPVCNLRPTFVHRGFPYSPLVPPLYALHRSGFFHSTCCPPFPHSLVHHLRRISALPAPLCLNLVLPHHEPFGCFKDSPVPLPRRFGCSGPQRDLSTPKIKGERSVDPTVARSSLRSSTMHLCKLLNCPPGLRFSPPAIVPNIARLDNRLLRYRATAPVKKSRR